MKPSIEQGEIRLANADDEAVVTDCVKAAYQIYLPRMDKPPAPLLADYAQLIADGLVHVLEKKRQIAGVLVLHFEQPTALLDNLAVHPDFQGDGLGSQLLAHAETLAQAAACHTFRLYTNAAMHENLRWYPQHGYLETARYEQDSYQRVFFEKTIK